MSKKNRVFSCVQCGKVKDVIFTSWKELEGHWDGQGVCATCGGKFCGVCMDSMDRLGQAHLPYFAIDRSAVKCLLCGGQLYAPDAR
jgi:hypothetical protein